MFNLTAHDINFLISCNILCFNETWLTTDLIDKPSFLNDYELFSVFATKNFLKGRASGGLLLCVKKNKLLTVRRLIATEYMLCILLKCKSECLIVGCIYWKPGLDNDFILESILDSLNYLFLNYSECKIIIGGDWNARLGELDSFDDEMFDSSNLVGCRSTLDHLISNRGEKLVDLMEHLGMIVCNGRSPSDSPAKYTYIGHNGASIVDLVWVSFSCINSIKDFEIVDIGHFSDHAVCLLTLLTESSMINLEKKKFCLCLSK